MQDCKRGCRANVPSTDGPPEAPLKLLLPAMADCTLPHHYTSATLTSKTAASALNLPGYGASWTSEGKCTTLGRHTAFGTLCRTDHQSMTPWHDVWWKLDGVSKLRT